jgi:chromosome partitioning protein
MKTLAIGNQKGGVGKTTTAVHLAHWFAMQMGARVLIVDLDAQGHVAESLGLRAGDGLFRWLVQGLPLSRCVVPGRLNLDVVTNDHTAELVKAHAQQSDFRAYLINMALESVEGYDLAVLDMPPSTDVLHVSALVASDALLVPAVMDHLALTGVMSIINTAAQLGRYPNVTPPALIGVLPTMFERSTNETMENVRRLQEALGDFRRLLPPVPRDVHVREASAFGQTVWEYWPTSPAAVGYDQGKLSRNSSGRTGGYLHAAEIARAALGF